MESGFHTFLIAAAAAANEKTELRSPAFSFPVCVLNPESILLFFSEALCCLCASVPGLSVCLVPSVACVCVCVSVCVSVCVCVCVCVCVWFV